MRGNLVPLQHKGNGFQLDKEWQANASNFHWDIGALALFVQQLTD